MIIDFQQGIVKYPKAGSAQIFLTISGNYINFNVGTQEFLATIAHKNSHYNVRVSGNNPAAFGPMVLNDSGISNWLYIDLNKSTGAVTFGHTTGGITVGTVQPTGAEGLHWFNTSTKEMFTYVSGGWRSVIRVFLARCSNGTINSLSSGASDIPPTFSGTQVGINAETRSGNILYDGSGKGIRSSTGEFLTTESFFYTRTGERINPVRLEAVTLSGTAATSTAVGNVIKLQTNGTIVPAVYNDVDTSVIGLTTESASTGDPCGYIVQGIMTNNTWNFPTPGAKLWVSDAGELSTTDLNVTDVLNHTTSKPHMGRVINSNTIIFGRNV